MKKQVLIGLMFIFLLSFSYAGMVYPHGFHGEVKDSSGNSLNGVIIAKISGLEVSRADVSGGNYNFVVESETEGDIISFYYEGESGVLVTKTFKNFEITELDLVVSVSTPTTTPPAPGNPGTTGNPGSNPRRKSSSNNNNDNSNKVIDLTTSSQTQDVAPAQNDSSNQIPLTGNVISENGNSSVGVGLISVLVVLLLGIIVVAVIKKSKPKKDEK